MFIDTDFDDGIPDDDASEYQDPEFRTWHFETAAAQDRLDEQTEDFRLELSEFWGIVEANRLLNIE